MSTPTKTIPIHPFLIAAYPVLTLLATNIREVEWSIVLRPLLAAEILAAIGLGLGYLVFRSWQRAAALDTVLLMLFFAYGHIYDLVKNFSLFNFNFGRHRFLVVIYAAITFLLVLWVVKRLKNPKNFTRIFNGIGLILLILPLFTITQSLVKISHAAQKAATTAANLQALTPNDPEYLPDVYVIVLDTYTRADALQRDFGFDNSAFINQLRSMGFYVADCAHTNETYTQGSITTVLNYDYLPELATRLVTKEGEAVDIWSLLLHSQVRSQLEALGYKTAAFDSGFEWSRMKDADIYITLSAGAFTLSPQPFESMLLKSTVLRILTDSQTRAIVERFKGVNFPFTNDVQLVNNTLENLPRMASISASKFVFAHILSPHVPYAFMPDGSLATDTGFYGGDKADAINDEYRRIGYTNQVQYINNQMISILKTILKNSKRPPVIVLMGDHGLRNQNRGLILNAYYLPNGGEKGLYSSISPVNSFRVIFNEYFGTNYDLLPDMTGNESGAYAVQADPLAECPQP